MSTAGVWVTQSRLPSADKMRPLTASMWLSSMSSVLFSEKGKRWPRRPGDHLGGDGSTATSAMDMSTRSTITTLSGGSVIRSR